MPHIDLPGAFYLGREHDLSSGTTSREAVQYPSKNLTTHAVCVGMTGSGKTGLCLSLLEEAALDGVPAIAIDPKGDLGNLLLAFPELRAEDFRPWVDEGEAERKGLSVDEYAAKTAETWRTGLAGWDETPERVQRFNDAVEKVIYTPGSSAGIPLSVVKSFAAPTAAVREDADALRERIISAVSGLLALVGIDADPVQSREHIFLSNILDTAWRSGRDLDIAAMIREIQDPPFQQVGVMGVENFYPASDRAKLAMNLNNLLASPSFAAWMQGPPLDVQRLFYSPEGKPRLSIMSIAHLGDAERMFFVTILLNEVLVWVRSQPGTSSLRALLYMDEVFGYFPPTANPPSKTPMLTLLKQARAYGLGCVLATQNPVDLDYKGLSNAGTWFLGRLQTERDKARVIEGLEGASTQAGSSFNKREMEAKLASLGNRVFLMNSVYDDAPTVFQTRWAMSYLRGPLTRTQIKELMDPVREEFEGATSSKPSDEASSVEVDEPPSKTSESRPVAPEKIPQKIVALRESLLDGERLVYRPGLWGHVKLHFVQGRGKLDVWQDCHLVKTWHATSSSVPWEGSVRLSDRPLFAEEAESHGEFAELPAELAQETSYKVYAKELSEYAYQTQGLPCRRCGLLDEDSLPGETEEVFKIRLRQRLREERDAAREKVAAKYAKRMESISDKIAKTQAKYEQQRSQYWSGVLGTVMRGVETVWAYASGRATYRKSTSTVSAAKKAATERGQAARVDEQLQQLIAEKEQVESQRDQELADVASQYDPANLQLDRTDVTPRKADIDVQQVALVWLPYRVDAAGKAMPAW